MKIEDIDLENNTFFGGLKTEAGKNRYVPIHPLIRELVVRRYEEAVEANSKFLFNDPEGQRGTTLTYDKYRSRFNKVLIKAVGYDTIQLITISRPSAYGEYEPYHFLETEQEFEEAVKNL